VFGVEYEGEGGTDAGGLFRDLLSHVITFFFARARIASSSSTLQLIRSVCVR
jgi:hypothetical protein